MNFDTIIIGGGLSGLVSGISLAKAGKSVAIVSKGQSTLHFHSGSFDLLGYTKDGHEVVSPLDEISNLEPSHPYSKVENIQSLVAEAEDFFKALGVKTKGDAQKNHYRITPMGVTKPTWLTLDEYFTTPEADYLPYNRLLLVNIAGFLDFPVEFVSEGLVGLGAKVNVKALQIPALQERRYYPLNR